MQKNKSVTFETDFENINYSFISMGNMQDPFRDDWK